MTTSEPHLPPAYRLVPLAEDADPFGSALASADSAEDGTLFWTTRPDRLDCAILLHPELPAAKAGLLAFVALVGLGDAIGALAPPVVGVEFGWPDRLLINGALAGGIRLSTADSGDTASIPAWQVLGIAVAILGDSRDPSPGLRPDTTTLHDEGAVEIDPVSLAESFSRHFLAWVHRWQEDGFAPVCDTWLSRAAGYQQPVDWRLNDTTVSGRFMGLDEEGGLLLASASGSSSYGTVPLAPALAVPTWTL